MTGFGDAVDAAFRALVASMPRDVGWALVGGLAVSSRAEPRFTRDVDLAVAVGDDSDAERLVAELVPLGWATWSVVEQEEVERLAQVRLRSAAAGQVVCDLLFASSGIEPEIVRDAERLELLPGLVVPVAQVGHLIAVKLLSVDDRRHQDRLDLDSLAAVAEPADWRVAEESVHLITQRGYHRGRDLVAALDSLQNPDHR